MKTSNASRTAKLSVVESNASRLRLREPFAVRATCLQASCCVLWSVVILGCVFGIARGADEKLAGAEQRALTSAANAESAYLRRANTQLVAPEVQQQIQELVDEISAACGSQKHFTVFLLNEGFLGTQSYANGDIFLPTAYLDMVEDRDELAFGLAREIALQIKDFRLKEMQEYLQRTRRKNNANLALSIIAGSAAGVAYGHYVERPIVERMMKFYTPKYHNLEAQFIYGNMEAQTGQMVNKSLGWVPVMVTQQIIGTSAHMIEAATEDADEEKRHLKDRLGIAFMQMAGYSGSAGQRVIKKLDDYWASGTDTTNAPPKSREH